MAVPQPSERGLFLVRPEQANAVRDFSAIPDDRARSVLTFVRNNLLDSQFSKPKTVEETVRVLGKTMGIDEAYNGTINNHLIGPQGALIREGEDVRIKPVNVEEVYAVAVVMDEVHRLGLRRGARIDWERKDDDTSLVGRARNRLGEDPLREKLHDPYPRDFSTSAGRMPDDIVTPQGHVILLKEPPFPGNVPYAEPSRVAIRVPSVVRDVPRETEESTTGISHQRDEVRPSSDASEPTVVSSEGELPRIDQLKALIAEAPPEIRQALEAKVIPLIMKHETDKISLQKAAREIGRAFEMGKRFPFQFYMVMKHGGGVEISEKNTPRGKSLLVDDAGYLGLGAVTLVAKTHPSSSEGVQRQWRGEGGILDMTIKTLEESKLVQDGVVYLPESKRPVKKVKTKTTQVSRGERIARKTAVQEREDTGITVTEEDNDTYLSRVATEIIGERPYISGADLYSSQAQRVHGLKMGHMNSLRETLDEKGIVRYDEEIHVNHRGRPRRIYDSDKVLAIAVIARKVGRRTEYADLDWPTIITELRSEYGEDSGVAQAIQDVQENPDQYSRKIVEIKGEEASREGIFNDRMRAMGDSGMKNPATVFSDDELVELWVNYRRLPNILDTLDKRSSSQHGISLTHADGVIRTAFGNTDQLTLLHYRTAVQRILEDAQQAGRLEGVRQRMMQEALAEIEEAPTVKDKSQEYEAEQGREHIIYISGPTEMPATFVEALDADYDAIFKNWVNISDEKEKEIFHPEQFGLTPETYDYFVRATEIVIARSHGQKPSFSHLMGRKPTTSEVRGALAVMSKYMKQRGITSASQLYDRIQ